MTRPLTDRVVVLTGVTAGIGRATALGLIGRGARVVGCARDVADLEPFAGLTAVEVMDLTRRVLPGMLARGDGDVVMISSVAAWVPTPSLAVYSGTKAGVDGFAQAVRREVGARGVRVHTVNAGPVRTEWLPRSAGSVPGEPDRMTRLGPGVPPDWVARAVEGCLTRPWSRTVAVPRALEAARLALLPGVGRVLDLALAPAATRIAGWALSLARERVHGPPPG